MAGKHFVFDENKSMVEAMSKEEINNLIKYQVIREPDTSGTYSVFTKPSDLVNLNDIISIDFPSLTNTTKLVFRGYPFEAQSSNTEINKTFISLGVGNTNLQIQHIYLNLDSNKIKAIVRSLDNSSSIKPYAIGIQYKVHI